MALLVVDPVHSRPNITVTPLKSGKQLIPRSYLTYKFFFSLHFGHMFIWQRTAVHDKECGKKEEIDAHNVETDHSRCC